MLPLIKQFVHCLFHPFKGLTPFVSKYAGGVNFGNSPYQKPLNMAEYLALTWPFIMAGAFYNLTLFPISKLFSDRLGLNFSENDFFISPVYTMIYELTLVAFYPFIGFLYVKLWTIVIGFVMDLLGREYELRDVELVASNTLVAKSFLIIPLIGPFLAKLMAPFYLYAGLKGRLGLSNGQALVIVLAPIFLVLSLVMIFLFLLVTFFSSL